MSVVFTCYKDLKFIITISIATSKITFLTRWWMGIWIGYVLQTVFCVCVCVWSKTLVSNVTFLYHTSEIFRRYKKVALGINGFTHFHEVFLQKQSSWLAQANYVTKYLWKSDTWEKMHNLYLYLKLYFFTGFFSQNLLVQINCLVFT